MPHLHTENINTQGPCINCQGTEASLPCIQLYRSRPNLAWNKASSGAAAREAPAASKIARVAPPIWVRRRGFGFALRCFSASRAFFRAVGAEGSGGTAGRWSCSMGDGVFVLARVGACENGLIASSSVRPWNSQVVMEGGFGTTCGASTCRWLFYTACSGVDPRVQQSLYHTPLETRELQMDGARLI